MEWKRIKENTIEKNTKDSRIEKKPKERKNLCSQRIHIPS